MSYIGNEPIVSATRTVTEITATAGQTTFTANGGYTVGYIDVFVNGAQLQSSDFTATNGTSITLNSPAVVGDDIRLVAWGTFNTANITSGSLTAGAPTWSPTGGVTLPRIDSSSEGGQLNFNRASDNTATWSIDSFGSGSTPSLRFIDGANERMRIDSSGNVGIGTSSPSVRLHVNGSDTYVAGIQSSSTFCYLGLRASGSGGSMSDPTVGIGATDNNLVARAGGAERMRITSGGDLCINRTTVLDQGKVNIEFAGNTNQGIVLNDSAAGSGNQQIRFKSGGTTVGNITTTTTATTYGTSSDYRLKENIAPMTGALSKVAELKPVTYTWKSNGLAGQGFIAHELQAIVPDAVVGEKDAVDAEGNPVYQGIDTSFLVATLTAAIQELKGIVDTQAAKLAELETKLEQGGV